MALGNYTTKHFLVVILDDSEPLNIPLPPSLGQAGFALVAGCVWGANFHCPLHFGSAHRWSEKRGFSGNQDGAADSHHETFPVSAC